MLREEEQEMFIIEKADDARVRHIVDSAIIDGHYYILGYRDNQWLFVYGAEDDEWGCQFDLFSEVGVPYQPWFEDAVLRHRRAAIPDAYDHGDVPIRFEFKEPYKGGPQVRPEDVPASVVRALGYRRAFEGWLKIPANQIVSWEEASLPADISGIVPARD